MAHVAAWVGPPRWKTGLDNLGTQQPCTFIYSSLLPGITNVTDRAWHYGFYPWFIRAFEQRHPEATEAEFRDALRRADSLATMVTARHAIVVGDDGRDDRKHGAAFPGRQKLVPAVRSLSSGGSIRLSDYVDPSDTNQLRYFKNGLGGLGQYYLGVLRDEYGALAGDMSSGVRYTSEIGLPLGKAFAEGLDEGTFLDVSESDEVSAADLDKLAAFCPCTYRDDHESARRYLADMILAQVTPWAKSGQPRRLTLGLALDLLACSDGAEADDEATAFLTSCYSGTAPSGNIWQPHERMADVRAKWALYLRNELLSLAWEAIFKTTLETIDGVRGIFSIREAANWCVEQPAFIEAETTLGYSSFAEAVTKESLSLPKITDTTSVRHELSLWRKLTKTKGTESIVAAMQMFVAIVARHGTSSNCYSQFGLPAGALLDYPLTLDTLGKAAAGPWSGLEVRAWLGTLVATALSVHQRVAIRKLGQSGDDTLMFRIGDDGIFVERRLEEMAETQPRVTQAFQILRDLGLTTPSSAKHLPKLTVKGRAALEDIING